jgi:hypothetical protein
MSYLSNSFDDESIYPLFAEMIFARKALDTIMASI